MVQQTYTENKHRFTRLHPQDTNANMIHFAPLNTQVPFPQQQTQSCVLSTCKDDCHINHQGHKDHVRFYQCSSTKNTCAHNHQLLRLYPDTLPALQQGRQFSCMLGLQCVDTYTSTDGLKGITMTRSYETCGNVQPEGAEALETLNNGFHTMRQARGVWLPGAVCQNNAAKWAEPSPQAHPILPSWPPAAPAPHPQVCSDQP